MLKMVYLYNFELHQIPRTTTCDTYHIQQCSRYVQGRSRPSIIRITVRITQIAATTHLTVTAPELITSPTSRALAAAGALPKHVARITIYVVDYRRDDHLPIIEAARVTLFGDHKPADVVVGIA